MLCNTLGICIGFSYIDTEVFSVFYVLDLMVEFMISHMAKNFKLDLYRCIIVLQFSRSFLYQ